MSTDALFGPDGTESPGPPPVLPDPLVGSGQDGAAGPLGGPSTPEPPLPAAPDVAQIRAAIMQAVADEVSQPAEDASTAGLADSTVLDATEFDDSTPTPPDGMPTLPGPPDLPGQPAPPPGALTPAAQLRYRPRSAAMQRPPIRAGHLTQERRTPTGGGWIGCIVVLIFLGALAFNLIRDLIGAITGG